MTTLESLEKNALWIIMDPWEHTPFENDLVCCPELDSLNNVVVKKITDYLPNLNTVLVTCLKGIKIHPLLSHIRNLNHNFELLRDYVLNNKINDIVYMGFHHGKCIVERPTGAANLQKHLPNVRLWLKRDMVGVLPWEDESLSDSKSKQYMTYI
jgi:hypothetical protein